MLAANGLRFEEHIKQLGNQPVTVEPTPAQEHQSAIHPKTQPTVKENSDEEEPSFVNVGDALSDYIS